MKITPLDIRQKSFNKKFFQGYDPDEVSAFMNSLSQAWERVLEENRELRYRLESAERDASQFREVQNGLYKAIQAADDKYAELIENGNQQANFLIREAKANADSTIKDAEWRSKTVIEEAEQQARNTWLELRNHVNALKTEYTQLEGMRQLLLSEIKNFSNELLERVDRVAINHKTVSFELPPMPSHLLANPAEKKPEDPTQGTNEGAKKPAPREAQPDAGQPSQGRPFIRLSAQQSKQTSRNPNPTPPPTSNEVPPTGNGGQGSTPSASTTQSVRPEAMQERTKQSPSAQRPTPSSTVAEPIRQSQVRSELDQALNQQQIDRPLAAPSKPPIDYKPQQITNSETNSTAKGGSFFDNI